MMGMARLCAVPGVIRGVLNARLRRMAGRGVRHLDAAWRTQRGAQGKREQQGKLDEGLTRSGHGFSALRAIAAGSRQTSVKPSAKRQRSAWEGTRALSYNGRALLSPGACSMRAFTGLSALWIMDLPGPWRAMPSPFFGARTL